MGGREGKSLRSRHPSFEEAPGIGNKNGKRKRERKKNED